MGGSAGWRSGLIPLTSNNLGQIVGQANHDGYPLAFSYDPKEYAPSWQGTPAGVGKLQDVTGDVVSTATGINDNGQIIGGIVFGGQQPFIGDRDHVTPIRLDALGGQSGLSEAINQSGDVVGWYLHGLGGNDLNPSIYDPAQRAFLFTDGAALDLNALLPTASDTILNDALGIDGSGRIVALGTNRAGEVHAYLLNPQPNAVPEPSTLLFFGTVLGALGVGRVVRQGLRRR